LRRKAGQKRNKKTKGESEPPSPSFFDRHIHSWFPDIYTIVSRYGIFWFPRLYMTEAMKSILAVFLGLCLAACAESRKLPMPDGPRVPVNVRAPGAALPPAPPLRENAP
jgi:hypothetical protein